MEFFILTGVASTNRQATATRSRAHAREATQAGREGLRKRYGQRDDCERSKEKRSHAWKNDGATWRTKRFSKLISELFILHILKCSHSQKFQTNPKFQKRRGVLTVLCPTLLSNYILTTLKPHPTTWRPNDIFLTSFSLYLPEKLCYCSETRHQLTPKHQTRQIFMPSFIF